jgi:dimethylhistidine N-methyltransferase
MFIQPARQPSTPISNPFAQDMLAALRERPRWISPKHFYDARGSALFEQICELPEYYPTRTELGILQRHADEIAALMGEQAELIEFGAGSLRKVRLLLNAMQAPARFVPIDISGEFLQQAARELRQDFPRLDIHPLVADYTQPLRLPPLHSSRGRRIGFFPGSTIGNFQPREAEDFLRMAARLLQGGALILGVDLIKSPDMLHQAYNDAQGITAAFNLNLLARANRELGTDFKLDQFAHYAFYNAPQQRVEMHLISQCRQTVRLNQWCFDIAEGDSFHTENSYKFTLDGLKRLATQAGFTPGPFWIDPARLFCLAWLQAPA